MNATLVLLILVTLATVAGATTDWWTYDFIGDTPKDDRTDRQKALWNASWVFGSVHLLILAGSWYVYIDRDKSA